MFTHQVAVNDVVWSADLHLMAWWPSFRFTYWNIWWDTECRGGVSDILQIKFFITYWIFWVMHWVIPLYGISQRNECFLAVPISSPSNMQQVVLDYMVPEAMNNLLLEIVFYKGKGHKLPYHNCREIWIHAFLKSNSIKWMKIVTDGNWTICQFHSPGF